MKYSTLCLLFFSPGGLALFLILGEKDHHCFHDEYESDVMLNFEFNATLRQQSTPVGLVFQIHDVERKMKIFEKDYASESTVTYRTGDAGSYGMCILTNSTKWAMYATGESLSPHTLISDYINSTN